MAPQEQLLQQIGSLVAAFNAERSQALAGAVQSLQARMESDCSAAVAEARGVAEAASTAAGRVQEVEAGVQAQLQQVRQHMGEQEAALRGAAHEASRQGTMALQGLQQQASAHAASLQAQCQVWYMSNQQLDLLSRLSAGMVQALERLVWRP